jgi:hypothetical protein
MNDNSLNNEPVTNVEFANNANTITNDPAPNNEPVKLTQIQMAKLAKKNGNKQIFRMFMRSLGHGKHFLRKGTKGAFGKARH